jgi:hypothetical protein
LRLRQEYLQAITEVSRLQTLQFQSVLSGEEDASLRKMLRAARRKWYQASSALLAHVQEHGCKE